MTANPYIKFYTEIGMDAVDEVGGKNASLGEMICHLAGLGVQVPEGFATTAHAYQAFLAHNQLGEKIQTALNEINVDDVAQLAEKGKIIREWVRQAPLQPEFEAAIKEAFGSIHQNEQYSYAVRSSATAEDLPDASFAGQQETFLNVSGIDNVLHSVKEVFASLFNDRAISYRVHQGFEHEKVSISAGVQRMVRSDVGASGVMFTLDTESGFDKVVFITSAYGLGELVVQGAINPDEFYVYKPALESGHFPIIRRNMGSKHTKMIYGQGDGELVKTIETTQEEQTAYSLTDDDIIALAKTAMTIEAHYQRPMDIEWAKDGIDGKLYIVQARPETVKSQDKGQTIERFRLVEKGSIKVTGRSIGQKIGQGRVKNIASIKEMHRVEAGDVLVTDMTDPDWEPIMKRAAAIVTNRGGRTCHAAIIARELGIPAVVGCGDATQNLKDNEFVTVSCAEGDTGYVYSGELNYERNEVNLDNMPELPFKIMLNVGNPDRAFGFHRLPNHGVGLARLEFIINRMIGVHPKALLSFSRLSNELQERIQEKMQGFSDPIEFYIARLAEGIATIAAAFTPNRVIVRLSDFKSNEYANLLGGELYEPEEENPMLGFRGASRYISDTFRVCFELECQALQRVRNDMGFKNVAVMVPFVRTVSEAKAVKELLADNGLVSGQDGLEIIMMCELPSNAILAKEFLAHFDGFSIGSNDLTQLTLGLDRDSGLIADLFDERDDAVKALLHQAIKVCKAEGKYIGICGQGPSDHIDFAAWLVDEGIDSVSLNPDSVLETWMHLAKNLKSQ